MKFLVASPNPHVLKSFTRNFRNTRLNHSWMVSQLDLNDLGIRNRLPPGTTWIRFRHITKVTRIKLADLHIITVPIQTVHSGLREAMDACASNTEMVVITPNSERDSTIILNVYMKFLGN